MGDFWAFFGYLLPCRRLFPNLQSGFCLQILVLDRPVSLVRELSARFYASEVSKFMVMPVLF
ncbi:hypothetical protein SLEP1_g22383 [Rubroshorea leprosula]|uniref:Uncharacterized protein n=1 Tax=Rubroshorea leprosula TaxID=152421 RepID=A0AAV5JIA0_9ROSI|nr:hypothetical protein SLEP1_g22383 [Rubroshorea leprosula]